jgi:hypothetical protein
MTRADGVSREIRWVPGAGVSCKRGGLPTRPFRRVAGPLLGLESCVSRTSTSAIGRPQWRRAARAARLPGASRAHDSFFAGLPRPAQCTHPTRAGARAHASARRRLRRGRGMGRAPGLQAPRRARPRATKRRRSAAGHPPPRAALLPAQHAAPAPVSTLARRRGPGLPAVLSWRSWHARPPRRRCGARARGARAAQAARPSARPRRVQAPAGLAQGPRHGRAAPRARAPPASTPARDPALDRAAGGRRRVARPAGLSGWGRRRAP